MYSDSLVIHSMVWHNLCGTSKIISGHFELSIGSYMIRVLTFQSLNESHHLLIWSSTQLRGPHHRKACIIFQERQNKTIWWSLVVCDWNSNCQWLLVKICSAMDGMLQGTLYLNSAVLSSGMWLKQNFCCVHQHYLSSVKVCMKLLH